MSQATLIFDKLVVHIVRFRADGDVSFLGALARRIISRGGRIVNRVGKDCTHIIFQEKPCCTATERAAEEAKLRDLFDKLDKAAQTERAQAPHVVSPLWVQESLKIGRGADEQEFVITRPAAAAIWLHGASTSSSDPSASSKIIQPRRKSNNSATATAAALLSTSSLAPAPLASLLMDEVNDMLLFSSSQAIREADGARPNKAPPPPTWAETLKQPSKVMHPKPGLQASMATERDEEAPGGSRKRTREEQPDPNNSLRRSSLCPPASGQSNISALLSRALSSVISPPGSSGGDVKKRRTSSNHVTPRTTPLNSPREGTNSAIVIPKVKVDHQVVDLTGSKNDMPSPLKKKQEIDEGEGNGKENMAGGGSDAVVKAVAAQKPLRQQLSTKTVKKMTDFFPLRDAEPFQIAKASRALPSTASKAKGICLAYSSLDAATIERVIAAASKLGAVVCREGQEESSGITHLIVGPDPKRTIKLLVAIARGCHIVTSQWILDSLTAGHFLQIDAYRSASRYSLTSDSVRSRRGEGEEHEGALLLQGMDIFLWPTRDDASSVKENHRLGIERVVCLLGGSISCSIPAAGSPHVCIQMVGSEGETKGGEVQGMRWVKEEWLLQMAEKQEPVDIESYYVQ